MRAVERDDVVIVTAGQVCRGRETLEIFAGEQGSLALGKREQPVGVGPCVRIVSRAAPLGVHACVGAASRWSGRFDLPRHDIRCPAANLAAYSGEVEQLIRRC